MKLTLSTVKYYFNHGLGTGQFIAPARVRAIDVVAHMTNGETATIGVITREMFEGTPHKRIKKYCEMMRMQLTDPKFRGGHFIVRTYGDVYTCTMEVPKS